MESKLRVGIKDVLKKCFPEKPVVVIQGGLALVSFVFYIFHAPMALAPNHGLSANPITVSKLQFNEYNEEMREGYFDQLGDTATGIQDWIGMATTNLGIVRGQWETAADTLIQTHVSGLPLTGGDAFNSVKAYQDYVNSALDGQKRAALATWETKANAHIALRLRDYLGVTTTDISDDVETDTETSQTTANNTTTNPTLTPQQIRDSFNDTQDEWNDDFDGKVDEGLQNFDDSLASINSNYDTFMRQINTTRTDQQAKLAAMETYKANVIKGIDQTVNGTDKLGADGQPIIVGGVTQKEGGLKGFLDDPANEALFGKGTTESPRTVAGAALAKLITDFNEKITEYNNAGLDKKFDTILSDLGGLMAGYFSKQAATAQATSQSYADRILTRYTNDVPNPPSNVNTDINSKQNGANLAFNDATYQAIYNWAKYGNTDQQTDEKRNKLAERMTVNANLSSELVVTQIFSANIFASSHPWFWEDAVNNATHSAWGTENNLLADRNNFHRWAETLNACSVCEPTYHQQDIFTYKVNYEVKNKTMEATAATWANFSNQLNNQFTLWNSTIGPVITTWQTQASNYKAFVAEWSKHADTLEGGAKEARDEATKKIKADKELFKSKMAEEKRLALLEWKRIEGQIAGNENLTANDVRDLLAGSPNTDSIVVPTKIDAEDTFNNALKDLKKVRFTFVAPNGSNPTVAQQQGRTNPKEMGYVKPQGDLLLSLSKKEIVDSNGGGLSLSKDRVGEIQSKEEELSRLDSIGSRSMGDSMSGGGFGGFAQTLGSGVSSFVRGGYDMVTGAATSLSKDGFGGFVKSTGEAVGAVFEKMTNPASYAENSYSIFEPEFEAPKASIKVGGEDLGKLFTKAINGAQNFAYVQGTQIAADKVQQDYYDSVVNQYKFVFKQEEMDRRREEAFKARMMEIYKLDEAGYQAMKVTGFSSIKKPEVMAKGSKDKWLGEEDIRKAFFSTLTDMDLLSQAERDAYNSGRCYQNVTTNCGGFMEESKDLKSVKVENGQIVIEREISDGSIHKGGNGTALTGGYTSGMQKDVIRVNLSQMGSVLKNPKDLFSEWTNADYKAVSDNLNTVATDLYASAEKDSKAVNNGIIDSVKRGEQFLELAMGRAEATIKKDELVKDIAIAYLTGGAAGIKSMVKDRIRDGFIEKAAEATGMDPQLVRFALGRFEQGQAAKKVAANRVSTTVAGVAAVGVSVMLPMAAPMMSSVLSRVGATAAQSLLSTAVASSGTIGVMGARTVIAANTYNNPLTQAVVGLGGAVTGSSGLVQSSNRLNDLKQQERGLIQDAVGATVASAMGLPPDAAGNISQVLGGIAKRKEQKRNNVKLDRVVSSGLATVTNMASGMVKGIVRNAVVAVGGSGSTFDQVTSSPFSAAPTWTGAAKVDTSKAGLIDRIQEHAVAELLTANGMDADVAKTVASTANGKIKAKKAKKEERIKAIESTVQTGLAVTALAVTGGAAAPAMSSVLSGTAGASFYTMQAASIATSMAISSRTGGSQGAAAAFLNGVVNSVAPIQFNNLPVALNISYDRKNGWGGGVAVGGSGGNASINASQRGGAQINVGNRFGSLNYDTSNGTYGVDVNVDSFFGGSKEMTRTGVLASIGANVGWNSANGTTAGINYDLENGNSLGLNFDRQGANITGDVDNTNLFTSSSDGSFQVNTNFANERMTNNGVNQAQAEFDREMERRETQAANDSIKTWGEKDPKIKEMLNGRDISSLSPDERRNILKEIGGRMGSANLAAGTSNRNPILGEITDGLRNIEQTVGIRNQVSGDSGMVDAAGNFHPRTCFTKGTKIHKLKDSVVASAANIELLEVNAELEELVNIEDIKQGNFVRSWNEKTGKMGYKKVLNTFERVAEGIYNLELSNGEMIQPTWNHPFWVLSTSPDSSVIDLSYTTSPLLRGKGNSLLAGKWTETKDLKVGDRLLAANGDIITVEDISYDAGQVTVYNFEVADNHTYFVGVDGVLVHNTDCVMPVLVQEAIHNFVNGVKETDTIQEAIKYGEGTKDSIDEKINLANSIKNCKGQCVKEVTQSIAGELTKPPIEGLGEGNPLTLGLNIIRMGGNVVKALANQGLDAIGWNGSKAAGKAHLDIATDVVLGAVGAKGLKALKEAGSKGAKIVTNEINETRKAIVNSAGDGVEDFARKNLPKRNLGNVTEDFVKRELPKEFVDNLKKIGIPEDKVASYFANYHNKDGKDFLNHIDDLLASSKYSKLTREEAITTAAYTTDLFYREFNNLSRANSSKAVELQTVLNRALSKMPQYEGGTAFRAMKFDSPDTLQGFLNSHKKGMTIEYNSFVSAGSSKEAAFFNKPKNSVQIEIRNLKPAPIISDFADGIKFRGYKKEELLLQPGRKFKVIDHKFDSGKSKIILEEQ